VTLAGPGRYVVQQRRFFATSRSWGADARTDALNAPMPEYVSADAADAAINYTYCWVAAVPRAARSVSREPLRPRSRRKRLRHGSWSRRSEARRSKTCLRCGAPVTPGEPRGQHARVASGDVVIRQVDAVTRCERVDRQGPLFGTEHLHRTAADRIVEVNRDHARVGGTGVRQHAVRPLAVVLKPNNRAGYQVPTPSDDSSNKCRGHAQDKRNPGREISPAEIMHARIVAPRAAVSDRTHIPRSAPRAPRSSTS
jgi:hypothetical protein